MIETLKWTWETILGMPWWFHAFIFVPLILLLSFRFVTLITGLLIRADEPSQKRVGKKEEKLEVAGLIGTMIASVVAVNIMKSVVDTETTIRLEEAMPNQLIQKKNKSSLFDVMEEQRSRTSVTDTMANLHKEFKQINSVEGLKSLFRLTDEYTGLKSLLDNSKVEESVLNIARISKLTDDLFQQGLSFLTKALNIARQLAPSNKESLITESKELQAELDKYSPDSTLYSMISERLERNRKSLEVIKTHSEKLAEYLCQVDLCRDSIREIRLEIPELLDNKPRDELDRIILELKTRVEYAQRVQAEYTRQGI